MPKLTNPVGRIEYLGTNGRTVETREFGSVKQMRGEIREECFYGAPICVVAYRYDGGSIPDLHLEELSTPPLGYRIEERSKK